MKFAVSAFLPMFITLVGCDEQFESKSSAQTQPSAVSSTTAVTSDKSHAHAPKGVKPGSHADWCGAHQVPESLCTRCNPSLIPGFKATNDWCEEHGLPESQCLKCNPELKITRPPKEGD